MTRTTTRQALVLVLALGGLAGCTEYNDVTLELGTTPVGMGIQVPIGFQCLDDSGLALLQRAISPTEFNFSVTIDFLQIEGFPSCRATELYNWCSEHSCQLVPGNANQQCVDFAHIPIPAGTGIEPRAVLASKLAALRGKLLDLTAPEGTVLIRLRAAAQACNTQPYQRGNLLGCAYSCPVVLDSVQGEILLDLPSLSRMCEPAVWVCASPDFQGN